MPFATVLTRGPLVICGTASFFVLLQKLCKSGGSMIAGVIAGIQDCWSLSEKKKKNRPTGTSKYILDCVCIYFERAVNDSYCISLYLPRLTPGVSLCASPCGVETRQTADWSGWSSQQSVSQLCRPAGSPASCCLHLEWRGVSYVSLFSDEDRTWAVSLAGK